MFGMEIMGVTYPKGVFEIQEEWNMVCFCDILYDVIPDGYMTWTCNPRAYNQLLYLLSDIPHCLQMQ